MCIIVYFCYFHLKKIQTSRLPLNLPYCNASLISSASESFFMKSVSKCRVTRQNRLLLLLALLFKTTAGLALDAVTLKLKWHHEFQFAGYYAAQELGYYREAGLDVSFKEAKPSDDVVEEVLSKKADFGTGSSGLILNRHNGQPVVVLGVIFQHSPYVLVTLKDSATPTIHDLAGKRIMIEPLAVELKAYLQREGIPQTSYTTLLHSFNFEDLLNQKSDAMAAYITSEPFYLKQMRADFHVFSPRSAGIDFYGDNLFTSEQQIREHPERVKAFREASFRGWQYAMTHPEKVIDIILAKYNTQHHSREQLRYEADQMLPLIQALQVDIGYMYPGRWQHIADVYAELGMLPKNFSLNGFLYTPNSKEDFRWIYYWFTIVSLIFVIVVGIATYIYRINKRLTISLAEVMKSRDQLSVLSTAIEQSPTSIIITNHQGLIEYVNPYFTTETGYSLEEVIGKKPGILSAGNVNSLSYQSLWNSLSEGRPWVGEFANRRKSGENYWEEAHISPVKNHDGNFIGYVAIKLNVTDRKLSEANQKALETRLNFLLKSTPAIIYSAQPSGNFGTTFVSENVLEQFGYNSELFVTDPTFWMTHIHPDDRETVHKGFETLFKQRFHTFEYRFQHHDGSYHWLQNQAVLAVSPDNQLTEIVGYWINITQQKIAEETQLESHKQLKRLIDNLFAYVALLDTDGTIREINNAPLERGGYYRENVIGKLFFETPWWSYDQDVKQRLLDAIAAANTGKLIRYDESVKMRSDLVPIDFQIGPFLDDNGQIVGLIATAVDILDRKNAENTIFNLAFKDPLTGLPNRRLILERLNHALSASERTNCFGCLIFIDLDNFKRLNDTFGHAHGDLLLIEVSNRLTSCVREIDTVARLGGDEFVLLLEDISPRVGDANRYAEQISEKIRVILAMPYELKNNLHYSSPSIGVCLFHGKQQSPDDILKFADTAMYQAKESGKNRIRFFDPEMQKAIEIRVALEADLRQAIHQQQLHLYYQIQMDQSLNPLGVEALIRWIHPEKGMIPPGQFIPIAEESSLILEIGQWVLDYACQQLAIWSQKPQTHHLVLSVNVSAIQFKQINFVEQVKTAINKHNIAPSRLKLELTESVALENLEAVISKMQILREDIGVQLSLDDFGTGYSSLSYLKLLPLNQIKIDQSFVKGINTDNSDAVMVTTIIELARNFGLDVIAEGVETEAHLAFLKKHGCKAYQGYLFSKPISAEEFEGLLKNHT